jgi:hypothetical protein
MGRTPRWCGSAAGLGDGRSPTLRQVVITSSNARKYELRMRPGDHHPVTGEACQRAGQRERSGTGFAPRQQAHVFEQFYQVAGITPAGDSALRLLYPVAPSSRQHQGRVRWLVAWRGEALLVSYPLATRKPWSLSPRGWCGKAAYRRRNSSPLPSTALLDTLPMLAVVPGVAGVPCPASSGKASAHPTLLPCGSIHVGALSYRLSMVWSSWYASSRMFARERNSTERSLGVKRLRVGRTCASFP